jgi:S-adenosyl methyltransferase
MERARQDATSQPGGDPANHPSPPGNRVQPARRLPDRDDAGTRFNPAVAHPARVYNAWLGGKDNYPADRDAAQEVIRHSPHVVAGALANRHFLARAVRFLTAQCGIRQFIDIGAGLPAPDNTHEIAQQITPASQVVYVDNDALVLAHARALLTSTPQGTCDYIDTDLRDTTAILAGAARTLDLSRPAAVLLLAVLHFVPDADDPAGIVAALASGLAPGSYIAISHLTADFAPATVTAGVDAYNTLVPQPITARTHAQVTALLTGLPLIPPGVVPLITWRPDLHDPSTPHCDLHAGLARTPRRPT